jgi:hypothetical protein
MPTTRSVPEQVRHLLAHGVDVVTHRMAIPELDDCERHAQECRDLAAKMDDPEVHEQLLEMARIWESIARERSQDIGERPQFGPLDGED